MANFTKWTCDHCGKEIETEDYEAPIDDGLIIYCEPDFPIDWAYVYLDPPTIDGECRKTLCDKCIEEFRDMIRKFVNYKEDK